MSASSSTANTSAATPCSNEQTQTYTIWMPKYENTVNDVHACTCIYNPADIVSSIMTTVEDVSYLLLIHSYSLSLTHTHTHTHTHKHTNRELFHGEKAETGYHAVSFFPPQRKRMLLICSPPSVFDLLKMPVWCF